MDTYFCPKCGESFQSYTVIKDGELLRCPNCENSRVLVKGKIFVALGLAIIFLATVTMSYLIPGTLVGGALCLTGAYRMVQERRAKRAHYYDDEEYID